ncbi:MAG: S8 family serine peptidase [Candidatus Zixiibacteriota bacterium]|nr:MAG: S8 family serine peptidase [candidate division Zixibacteria bacterium]
MTSNKRTLIPIAMVLVCLALWAGAAPILSATAVQPDEESPSLTPRQLAVKPQQISVSKLVNIDRVVVKFIDDYGVRIQAGRLVSLKGLRTDEAETILAPYVPSHIRPLIPQITETEFARQRSRLQDEAACELADLASYFALDVQDPDEAERIINNLNALDYVEIAYFEPKPEPAGDIDPPTDDFSPFQDYREAAPDGVDADYANTLTGGDGAGVKIIDIEGAWQTTHEDLDKSVGGELSGAMVDDLSWRNHGTAVIGEMIAGDNGYGVTGICPGADIGMVSIASLSTAEAIYMAVEDLQPGDLILIELHAPGPHYDFESRDDQLGYVCMEYWQANFDAMQYAWASGITVVEAAGNGAEDFDDELIYGQLFDTTYRNSHAILAGAGWPAASAYDRIKHGFSNYGERVNLQGYGSGVYTTGYGGLFAPNGDENQFYTATFSGTSSASPIVTGAAACLQGYYKATYGTYMTADMIRTELVSTGSPQLGDTSLHIGPRPDLLAAIAGLSGPASLYLEPLLVDTVLGENDSAVVDLWLHNRSGSSTLDFSIEGNDSLPRSIIADWLYASPTTGSISPSDSFHIAVTLDATVLEAGPELYKGSLDIHWSAAGQPLDSLALMPVFLQVACADDSYLAASSDDTGGPTYSWISVVDLGSRIPAITFYNSHGGDPLDDGTTGPQAIGFDFRFYGSDYSQVWIAVNGALSFTESEINVNGYYSGLSIPGAPFSTFVAPFYADLIIDNFTYPNSGIYLYRSPGNDTLVIQWHDVANFNSQGTTTDFEVVLSSDGNLLFQYLDVENSGLAGRALVGIQATGCQALEYSNTDGPAENNPTDLSAVLFSINYAGCCVGRTGNINCDIDDVTDMGDLTRLIDYLFISFEELCCEAEADVNSDTQTDIGDLTELIDYLFISFEELDYCP